MADYQITHGPDCPSRRRPPYSRAGRVRVSAARGSAAPSIARPSTMLFAMCANAALSPFSSRPPAAATGVFSAARRRSRQRGRQGRRRPRPRAPPHRNGRLPHQSPSDRSAGGRLVRHERRPDLHEGVHETPQITPAGRWKGPLTRMARRRWPMPDVRTGRTPHDAGAAVARGSAPITSPRLERPAQTRAILPRHPKHVEGAPVSRDGGAFIISYRADRARPADPDVR
jgi:hypothetical protein